MTVILPDLVIALILVLGYYSSNTIIILSALILFLVRLIKSKSEYKFCILLFYVPWIYVMKVDINSTSFFTIGILVYLFQEVFIIIYKRKRVNRDLLLNYIILVVYTFFIHLKQGNGVLSTTVSFLVYQFAFFIVLNKYKVENFKLYTLSYSLGILSSGITGLFLKNIPMMGYFINYTTIKIDEEIVNRFTGLNWDPNYFGMQILICISLLMILYFYHTKTFYLVIMCGVGALGFLTVSKSYLIVLLILVSLFISILTYKRYWFKKLNLSVFTIMITILIIIILPEISARYLTRFEVVTNSSNKLDALFTGRVGIQGDYLNYFRMHIGNLFFGHGVAKGFGVIGKAPHNLYICVIYFMGIFGSCIYIQYIYTYYKKIKKINLRGIVKKRVLAINCLPLICFIIIFTSLDGFLEQYFSLQLALVIMGSTYTDSYEKINKFIELQL